MVWGGLEGSKDPSIRSRECSDWSSPWGWDTERGGTLKYPTFGPRHDDVNVALDNVVNIVTSSGSCDVITGNGKL